MKAKTLIFIWLKSLKGLKKTFFLPTVFKDFLLIFRIGNSRVINNIFLIKINHDS